jgi:putative transposase
MPVYTRAFVYGGVFFFTVVTDGRRPILNRPNARRALRDAFSVVRDTRPFDIEAIVLLPDPLHTIWRLPEPDADSATRWRLIKSRFTRDFLAEGGAERPRSGSRVRQGERGVWQRRYWEHTVRDEKEFAALCDYIHYNPVKHGYADCPHAWPYSSFGKFIQGGVYSPDWQCGCSRRDLVGSEIAVSEEIVGE